MARLHDYIPIVGQPIIDDLMLVAEKLKGKIVQHINSTGHFRETMAAEASALQAATIIKTGRLTSCVKSSLILFYGRPIWTSPLMV
jgi:hypothetical protein